MLDKGLDSNNTDSITFAPTAPSVKPPRRERGYAGQEGDTCHSTLMFLYEGRDTVTLCNTNSYLTITERRFSNWDFDNMPSDTVVGYCFPNMLCRGIGMYLHCRQQFQL